ncbi:MAG: Rha family transcriptional regulator [Snodgrassella sp.]|uniref:Rha family transcriptional regulator n=1 Tax=Snodgrassella sp. TaxID=2815304 RepID=UPI00258B6685|nr:Rha family transcriptional regulator [Snodgrassella sp.]MCO6520556.1 Rha family transcriptional regulator [Snodgrassella sp.]
MNTVAIDFEQFVQINHSEPVTTSEFVAKAFGKKHCNVLARIEGIRTQVPDSFYKLNFKALEQEVKSNLGIGTYKTKIFELTKNGFMLLVMGFTGKEAMAVKIAYINAFDTMAERLHRLQMHHVAINHFISKEQADNIQLAVEQRSQRTGESYQKIYAGLHAYLRIDSYKTMPVEHYTAALKYLESVPDAPELFKPVVNDGQVLPNINKDGRWLVIVKNSIATHVRNISGYNCVNMEAFDKLMMQTKQQAEYLLELARRMRVAEGECSLSRLDVPIEELHTKFII